MNLGTKLAIAVGCWGVGKAFINEYQLRRGVWGEAEPGSLYACTVAPVLEETIFRGVLNPLLGPATSTALFAMGHRQNNMRMLDAVALGSAFTAIAAHGGLPLAIAAHAAHNAGRGLTHAYFASKRAAAPAEAARLEGVRRALVRT